MYNSRLSAFPIQIVNIQRVSEVKVSLQRYQIHERQRTDRHGEANGRFSQLCEKRLQTEALGAPTAFERWAEARAFVVHFVTSGYIS